MDWILPLDRPGYRHYHDLVRGMAVIGKGRRGEGEIILGPEGLTPDLSSPLAPVFAYGAIETKDGTLSVTMREILDGQISVEIVSHKSEEIPSRSEEHTSELQSLAYLVCRLLLEKKKSYILTTLSFNEFNYTTDVVSCVR